MKTSFRFPLEVQQAITNSLQRTAQEVTPFAFAKVAPSCSAAELNLYDHAINLGAEDDGGPGKRGDVGFYAAYIRDLDGNKLALFCIESTPE